jgi:hypothetical protein
MELSEIIPQKDFVQDLHCGECKKHLDLTFINFHENVSGVDIKVNGLPMLRCESCERDHFPDRSRSYIIRLHKQATKLAAPGVQAGRKKLRRDFKLTHVPFIYDSDDYEYIPGLKRPWDDGFLTPVFFNRQALTKYEALPGYRVKFASTTYGEIASDTFSIAFGINKHGKLTMWLGDLAELPESEQYYLKSENVPSDHSIGSEFYDGQIDCVFTEPSKEDRLFAARSSFLDVCLTKFGTKLAHLDSEVLDLARALNPPIIDTEKERQHTSDALNKIYIESFDNPALEKILERLHIKPTGTGTLKRLQALLEGATSGVDVHTLLSPFYVLYDFRVASLHLIPEEKIAEKMKTITDRLKLNASAGLAEIYSALIEGMLTFFNTLEEAMS